MTSKTGQIHHLELYVSDLEKSKMFWSWFLGKLEYEVFENWKGGQSYKLGNYYIALVQVDKKHRNPPYHRKRVGLNHLAFYAKSKRQVDKIKKELKEKKIPILYGDRYPNDEWYAVFFEDPDRIKVELVTIE